MEYAICKTDANICKLSYVKQMQITMAVRGALLALNIISMYLLLYSKTRIKVPVFSDETFKEEISLFKKLEDFIWGKIY